MTAAIAITYFCFFDRDVFPSIVRGLAFVLSRLAADVCNVIEAIYFSLSLSLSTYLPLAC